MSMSTTYRRCGLPPSLSDFASRAGLDAALRLAETAGGQRKYIPRKEALYEGHWLVLALGWSAAHILAEMWGGESWDIPAAVSYTSKKQAILNTQGSASAVARKYGVSARYVKRLRAEDNG